MSNATIETLGQTQENLAKLKAELDIAAVKQREANEENEVNYQERMRLREDYEYYQLNWAPNDEDLVEAKNAYDEAEEEWYLSIDKAKASDAYYKAAEQAYLKALAEYIQ